MKDNTDYHRWQVRIERPITQSERDRRVYFEGSRLDRVMYCFAKDEASARVVALEPLNEDWKVTSVIKSD